MTDEHSYVVQSPAGRLRVWVLGQMLWGALLAGIAVVAIGIVLGAIWALSLVLPAESKQAPSPYGALEIARSIEVA